MARVGSFLVKIFVVVCFASFLVFFGFLQNNQPQQAVSAKDLGYGNPVCDTIIPIGNVMDELLLILDDAFGVYQGENLNTTLDTVTGLVTALGSHQDVCDFSECKAGVKDTGGKATFEVDAYIESYGISLDPVPPGWCNISECAGAPCPDVTPYLKGKPEMTGIVGLEKLKSSFEASAAFLHKMFTEATEPLSVELVKEGEAVGKKVTKAEYLDRLIEYTEYWLTPGHEESCVLTPLEKKLVESKRRGNKFALKCEEARDQGLYWPRAWSRECDKDCSGASLEKCLRCLKKDPGDKGSFLAQINYKIYSQCEEECRLKDDQSQFIDEWALDDDCEKCLCRKPIEPVAGSGGITGGAQEQMSPEECLAWLCGGSRHNWVCCHETPLAGTPERPEITPISPPPEPSFVVPSGPPSAPSAGPTPSCVSGQKVTVGTCAGDCCSDANLNVCGTTPTDCCKNNVAKYESAIQAAASGRSICLGVDTVKLVKAIMSQESCGLIGKGSSDRQSAGLMQLTPSTARSFKGRCGASGFPDNDSDAFEWLKKEENAQTQICMAIEYLKTLVAPCGCDVRHLAAGYNGGGAALGACNESTNCGSAAAADGGQCLMCPGTGKTRRWECLWDDNQHTICNVTKASNFNFTRRYVPKVNYCYGQF